MVYLLDTNAASDVMNGRSDAARATLAHEGRSAVVAISSITSGELRFGIRKRGSVRLQRAFDKFCLAEEILPWDDSVAVAYSELRYNLARKGKALSTLDMMIAAHAAAIDAVLVTRDRAFQQVCDVVKVVNWATDFR